MPARNPRVNVVLEKPLYEAVDHLAKEEGVSRSTVVRDLVKEAIEKIRRKADKLGAEARGKYREQIEDLRARQETARKKLEDLKRTGGEAWEDLRSGAEAALDELKKGVEGAVAKLKKG